MNKIFTLILFSLFTVTSFAQNIDWEAQMNTVRIREDYSVFCSCPCWETGTEEFTAKVRMKDNIMGAFSGFICMTCDRDGDWNCGVDGTLVTSNSNVNATTLTVSYDGFEDDGGDRCNHDSGDDCRCSNDGLASISVRSGTLCGWQIYGPYSCNTYHDNLRVKVRWRWSLAQFSTHPSNQTACEGTNATFSAALNSSYNGGVTYQWQYFDGTTWQNQGSSSTTYSNLVVTASTAINGRQYRLQSIQCNWEGVNRVVNSNPATLTVNTNSVAAASITGATTKCGAGTVSLGISGGSLGTGASWKWYTGSCGGTLLTTGSTANPSVPVGTTTYYLRAEGTCNTTACVTKVITVNNPSVVAGGSSVTPSAICTGSTVSVTATGGSLGTSAAWKWYANPGLTTLISSTNPANINPVSYPTVYVRAEDATGICAPTSAISVDLTGVNIHTANSNPTSTDYSTTPALSCDGESLTINIIGGSLGAYATWKIYSTDPTVGSPTALASSTGTSISWVPTSSGTYYIRGENFCGNTSVVTANVIVNGSTSSSGNLASVSSSSTCVVADSDWHYFRNSAGDVIAAINSNGQDLGEVTMGVVTGNDGPFGTGGPSGSLCEGAGGEYHIPRYFTVSSDNAATGFVSFIVYFTPTEYASHKATSDAQDALYKHCYGNTSTAGDLVISVFESDGTAERITSISRSLSSGPSSSHAYQFDLSPASLMPRVNNPTQRYDNAGTAMYIHNAGGLFPILPVELVAFDATYKDLTVLLEWNTASEFNNQEFRIERSLDGKDFVEIGKVNGNGTSTIPQYYKFTDNDLQTGTTLYYRLKQVDFDGKFEYSAIKSVIVPATQGLVVGDFFPNPASQSSSLIMSSSSKLDNVLLAIYRADGSLIETRKIQILEGINKVPFDLSGYAAGVYLATINHGEFSKTVVLSVAE